MEGAGNVEAVGPDVSLVRVGDRVGYCTSGPGSYAEARLADEGPRSYHCRTASMTKPPLQAY